MIEIIRPGTKRQIECPNCGALLSYDEALDVEIEEAQSVIGVFNKSRFIKCPQCNHKIILEQTR